MRNISAAALSFLTTQKGIEPLNFVKIDWTDSTSIYYADRTIAGMKGSILELSNLDNVVNISGSNASQSVSITLDDTDAEIKNIYNYNDIHKRSVTVYQWFVGLNLSDAFIIFQGYINSPIVWKESDRTVSFEIVSKLEDIEVGFSPEEGEFDQIPTSMIGKAWPLPFGTCLKIPSILIDPINNLTTLDANGIPDPSLPEQLAALSKKIIELGQFADTMFKIANFMYLQASPHNPNIVEDQHFEDLGDQYVASGNQALVEQAKAYHDLANLGQLYATQKKFAKSGIRVTGAECLQPGQSLTANIGGAKHLVTVDGSTFIVQNAEHPSEQGTLENTQVQTIPMETSVGEGPQEVVQKQGFFWIPAGTNVYITSEMPVRYIVAMIPVTVFNVWSSRNFNDAKVLMQVPTEYYTVGTVSFGSIIATVLTLPIPLSQKQEGWSDDLFVDVQSPIGPNTIDIISYLITNYTTLGIDAASFNAVAARINVFPSDFCLFNKENIVKLLSDIAYRARLAIWLNNGVFYVNYLPDEPTPVDTITEADLITNSLEIHHSDTESIVTKLIASYKTDYSIEKNNKIILRNNIVKYGTHEEEDDWFIYLNQYMVDLAATFWLIRKSNTWKLLNFKTPLHKLRLETFDAVTINFSHNYACVGPITGIINSIHFDSQNLQLEFEIWIPVRLGEMSKYNFAWPIDSEVNIYPDNVALAGSGGPGASANGNLTLFQGTCYNPQPFKKNERKSINHGHTNPGGSPQGTVVLTTGIQGIDTTNRPNFRYNYNQYRVRPPNVEQAKPITVPAQIVSGTNPNYDVKLYMKGLQGPAIPAKASCVDPDADNLNVDTWIMVTILVWTDNTDGTNKVNVQKVFAPSVGKPGVFPGKITAGSGSTYTVDLYKEGLTGDPVSVSCKQLDIDPTDSIPSNTWALVGESKNKDTGEVEYFFQVPIWLE